MFIYSSLESQLKLHPLFLSDLKSKSEADLNIINFQFYVAICLKREQISINKVRREKSC